MGKKPATVAAFEYGPFALKFAEMTRGEKRVLSAGIFPLEPDRHRDWEYVAARARSILASASGRIERLIASVPVGHAHLRVVEVPAGAANPREHLAWDMARWLARPASQYVMNFEPAEDPGAENGRYVAAAFRRAEAVALRAALESASGLPLAALDVDAAAAVNAFAANYPEFPLGRAVLIQANRHAAAIVRVRDGSLLGVSLRRDAGAALGSGAETQERAEGLLHLARGIAEELREGGAGPGGPDRVFLCGDLAVDEDFRELLRDRLPVPFQLLNPFRTVPGPDPAQSPGVYPGAPYAAAVGLVLRLAEEP